MHLFCFCKIYVILHNYTYCLEGYTQNSSDYFRTVGWGREKFFYFHFLQSLLCMLLEIFFQAGQETVRAPSGDVGPSLLQSQSRLSLGSQFPLLQSCPGFRTLVPHRHPHTRRSYFPLETLPLPLFVHLQAAQRKLANGSVPSHLHLQRTMQVDGHK